MAATLVCAGAVRAQERPIDADKIILVGDSTTSVGSGWGGAFCDRHVLSSLACVNLGRQGRSTSTYRAEGSWDLALNEMATPGYGAVWVLIQFGHNDAKFEDASRYTDPVGDYPAFLQRYVQLARDKGATPVLVTPVARLLYDFGSLLDTHGRYTQSMKALAAREQIALIDLNDRSMRWVRALGEEGARPYFLFVPEQGKADGTHFSVAGAHAVACLVLREAVPLLPALQPQLVRDIDCDVVAEGQGSDPALPSQVVHEDSVVRTQAGPHGGAGPTTAYPFFADAEGLPFVLRKRVLHKGAGIGLHPQHKDEIYYIVSGQGSYVLDGRQYDVHAGHALLTRKGSHHALQQVGEEDLVVLLVYPR
ncbi:MAG TPA: rhamnogalacturonan acetylesterase [Brevundimonas sp.]|nr:rhamnogalacturonan acetylesterase [Brevundimonas sp.]